MPAAGCQEGGFKLHFINFYNQSLYKKAMLFIKSLSCNPRDIIQLPAGSLIKCVQIRCSWLQIGITLVSLQ